MRRLPKRRAEQAHKMIRREAGFSRDFPQTLGRRMSNEEPIVRAE
jgi:hypothetical protein